MSLKTRKEFRKRYQKLILSVRIILFLGIPVLYTAISQLTGGHDNYKDVEAVIPPSFDYKMRHLLAQPTTEKIKNCTPAAILDFPPDGFTREQRRAGWIAVHCLLACYCFVLLAIVCDDYFVPTIEQMCHKLKMSEDVAGATFMAAASSSPELFINCVGTFVTEGDLGVGTIVGSAVFNILAVPACCGLLAGQVIDLDWWAVSRDSLMYGMAVISLIFTLQDDKVQWYEALILVIAYTMYIIAMFYNSAMNKYVKKGCCGFGRSNTYTEVTPLLAKEKRGPLDISQNTDIESMGKTSETTKNIENDNELESSTEVWKWPNEDVSFGGKLFWLATWPLSFILYISVPDVRKHKNLYYVTFFMCIVWIGLTSYFTAWCITAIGDTVNIPDSVMGLTFLAAGTSVPEAVSSVIVTNQGHGSMGISSSIGSNTFDILLCLGLPWLIKSVFYPTVPGEHWVNINSSGLTYSAISLLSTLFGLYISFVCNKFLLDWKIGLTCTMMYIAFLALATLIELNVFFPVNLPSCAH